MFPRLDFAGYRTKEGMGKRIKGMIEERERGRSTFGKLPGEQAPLVAELSHGHLEEAPALVVIHQPRRTPWIDAVLVECVAPAPRLRQHDLQIASNGGAGIRDGKKTLELRVMSVASRPAGDDGLSEKCLAPESDNSLWIEVTRVQAPQSHARIVSFGILGVYPYRVE